MVVRSMETPVQRELVAAARDGDHEAFEVLAKGAADREGERIHCAHHCRARLWREIAGQHGVAMVL